MRLIDNWGQVFLRSWSIWGSLLMVFVSAVFMALPFFNEALQFDPLTFAIVMLLLGLLNSALRVMHQGDLMRRFMRDTSGAVGRRVAGGAVGLTMLVAMAAPLISGFEGRETTAYRDIVGIWTICDGETLNVQPGDTATDAQCDEMLARRVRQFSVKISACLPPDLPLEAMAAFTSAAYNIGASGFCGSSMSRRARAGDLPGACNALLMWDKGRIKGVLQPIRGLTIRRQKERALCLSGLA
jgi:lysozyme